MLACSKRGLCWLPRGWDYFAGHSAAAQRRYRHRVAGPMTGQFAAFGEQMKRAPNRLSPTSTPPAASTGEKIKLEVGDDACDPKQAVAVANQLAGKERRVRRRPFLLGLVDPGFGQVYTEEGILQISPASTNPKFTDEAQAATSSASAAVTTSRARSPASSSPSTTRARTSRSSTTRPPTARAWPTRPRRP